eukprot:TRINITY_DN69805_c0_g1_i5.p1 TRINITY_DN69805_c0_g1~~TRINITY_DN69805_c0_g1_i5.p1  ORF type:complete len:466 (-),score=44.94 TRINITY_DN69805_c0_g1_i5:520-1869(-)
MNCTCKMGNAESEFAPPPPPKYVLVPPLFDTNREFLRERFLESPYDYLFAKADLKKLFGHYYHAGGGSMGVNFAPVGEPQFFISARGNFQNFNDQSNPQAKSGEVVFRYQPNAQRLANFVDVKVGHGETQNIVARGSFLHPTSGLGISAVVPFQELLNVLNVNADGECRLETVEEVEATEPAQLQLKVVGQDLSIGAIADMKRQAVYEMWFVGRRGPLMLGASVDCDIQQQDVLQQDTLLSKNYRQADISLAYTTKGFEKYGEGHFTAAMELKQFNQLCLSFFQHLPVRRNCYNPFEDEDVVGVTDYVDLGLTISSPLTSNASRETDQIPNMQFGASWQFGKNFLAKCAIGFESISAAFVYRNWGQPSLIAGVSAKWDWGSEGLKYGACIQFENEGVTQYERAISKGLQGRSVLQKHLASSKDVMMSEGKIPMVNIVKSGKIYKSNLLV